MPVGFGHIEKIRFRNRDDFESLSSHAGAEGTSRGVSILGGQYNFTDDTNIGAISQYGWDMFHTAYVEAVHFYQLTDALSLKTGIQFTDQRSVGDEILGSFDAQHLGYKFALGYQSLIIGGSVTWASGGDGIRNPWGGSPSYNSVMISDFDRPGEVAVRGGLSYDFSEMGMDGLAASVSWLHGNTPDSGTDSSPDQQEFNINLDYRPAIEGIDNLWLRLRYAENDGDASLGGVRRKDFRVILNYTFTF